MRQRKEGQGKGIIFMLLLVLVAALAAGQGLLQLDKNEYMVGDPVSISIADPADKILKIQSQSKLYTYQGELPSQVVFKTSDLGEHIVSLENRETRQVLENQLFKVLGDDEAYSESQIEGPAPTLHTDKSVYLENDKVLVKIDGTIYREHRLFIVGGSDHMLYTGDLLPELDFTAPTPGHYRLEIRDAARRIIALTDFEVEQDTEEETKPAETEPEDKEIETPEKPTEDSKPNAFHIKGTRGNIVQNGKAHSLNSLNGLSGKADVALQLPGIAGLSFNELNLSNMSLRAQKIPKGRIGLDQENVLDVIALDPTGLDFAAGTMRRTAKGTSLYKCRLWNYDQQACEGTWEKVMDLVPGQEYEVILSPDDPAFAEAGVATVNTKKPMYRQNQAVEIVMVVLDTEGYLVSNANITLIVTSPDNSTTTLTTSEGEITETSRGVYEANFTSTSLEGIYLLNITAQVTNITQEMNSYFFVNDTYDFDIVRDMPVKIDPRNSYRTTINIEPFVSVGSYNFTEVLPINFTILNNGGASVTSDSNYLYLTWTGLSGNSSVAYTADAPDIIPNIEVIGPSFIEYDSGVFEEARPWYLAIDPITFVRSGGVTGVSFAFDIDTPNDRLVVIFAGVESTGTSLTGVTVDSNPCNLVVVADNPTDAGNHQELWYCDEDDLGASSESVTVAITGGGATWGVHAHLYTGVSQSGYNDVGIDNTSAAVNTITVNGIDVVEDGLVVAGWGEGTGGLTISTQTSPLTTQQDGPDPSSADLFTSYGVESAAQSSKTYSVTLSGAHNRATGIVASWNLANTPPTTPTNIQCDDSNNCNITVTGSVVLNASGSTDSDGDNITYVLEASLQNNSTAQDTTDVGFTGIAGDGGWSSPTTVWTKSTALGCTAWTGNSGWETAEFRFWIDDDNRDSSGDFDSVRYEFCSGDDSALRILNVSTCWVDNQNPSTNTACDDALQTNTGEGLTGSWLYSQTAQSGSPGGTCEFTPWMNYTWMGNRNYFVQWGTETGTYDGNVYSNTGCSVSRLSRIQDTVADVMDPAWATDAWEAFSYDFESIEGRTRITGPANDTNTTETNYTDLVEDYYSVSNITITVEIDIYDPSVSASQSTRDPDIEIQIYNGTGFISAGLMSLNETYTGDAQNTTNVNFSIIVTDSATLKAWETVANQDISIRGVYMDYFNDTSSDEINYTNVWVTINGKKWQIIGNHTETTSFNWVTTNISDQTGVDLRARAIDLDGSATYSSYFTKGSNMELSQSSGPSISNLLPLNNQNFGFGSTITISATVTDSDGVDKVFANITFPDSSKTSIEMTPVGGDQYSGTFTAWDRGEYYYGIWANDTTGQVGFQDPFFYVVGNATINVTTEKAEYNASELVMLEDVASSSDWWNESFRFRKKFTFQEPNEFARTDTHIMINVSLDEKKLFNENGTLMICDGSMVPFDAYAVNFTNGWVTGLEGVLETDIGLNEALECYLYYDPNYNAIQVLPTTTGWNYVCDDSFSGTCGVPADVTPANMDASGSYASLNLDPITCGGDGETFYHNMWCYFKAPSNGSLTIATASDDGSELFIDGSLVVDNTACQATACVSNTYDVVTNQLYTMKATYDENDGGNDMYVLHTPTVCGGGDPSGNFVDTECYPFFGDEWLITITEGSEEKAQSILDNIGTTNISGYLLMQVFTNTSGPWLPVTTILNDTDTSTLRTILVNEFLNLAPLWNGNAWNTSQGIAGYYRAYSAFVDNEGNILRNDDNSTINSSDIFTILNSVPTVQSISLLPAFPIDNTDLNCSFIITDGNTADTLTVNVTWYLDNVTTLSSVIPASNGGETTSILGAGNTTVGDFWHCGVTPSDGIVNGNQVNSSIIKILSNLPPVINQVQCYENNSVWTACSNIQYNDNLTGVRVNCTDPEGIGVANATFSLLNIEDMNIFFTNSTTDNSTYPGYFYVDNEDLHVLDSGNFNLSLQCVDLNDTIGEDILSWWIPFGTRTVELVNPLSNKNVTQYRFFNFTSSITCTGGECGSYNATLDPPLPWDNPNYKYRVYVNLSEPQSFARTNEHVRLSISLNTSELPLTNENGTSLYCEGTREPWDAYATSTSSGWITTLEGLGELDFSADEQKDCFIYFDDTYTMLELQPTATGWGYQCDDSYSGTCGLPGDVTPANTDANGIYADLNLPVITCGGDMETFYHNMWCYFKAPDSGTQTMGVASDDGTNMTIEGTTVINNMYCQGTYCRTGTYSFTEDRYYSIEVDYDENAGSNDAYAYYNPTVCGASGDGSGNTLGNECYAFFGDEWEINVAYGEEEKAKTGEIPFNITTAKPFYTIDPNPRQPTDLACLVDMISGNVCTITWEVNATGAVGSVHEFYVEYTPWNYTTYIGSNFTSSIDITIIGNSPPLVTLINISPIFPIDSDNLTCAFKIDDQNEGDTITANFSWFLNGAEYYNSLIGVTSGAINTQILDFSNTGLGEIWFCSVQPSDGSVSGTRVNSTTVNILSNRPPELNYIQCQENNSIWQACDLIQYNDQLTGVRVNCTDIDGSVINATFTVINSPDNTTFFSNTTSDNSTYSWEYFYFDNNDFNIRDSGYWNLTVTCNDDNSSSNSDYVDWFVPWGVLNSVLVNPVSDTNVQKDEFFDFTVNVTCTGGECGSVNATLDPDDWDNRTFQWRIQINVSEPQGLERNETHFRVNLTMPEERLSNENGTIMYCDGDQVPWDAYAIATSNGWVTGLQGLAEINISGSESMSCYVYMDPSYNATEKPLQNSGWQYVGANSYVGGSVIDLTTSDVDCSGLDSDGEFTSICGSSDNIKLNEWCYLESPVSSSNFVLKTCSDDGSNLLFEGAIAVGDNDGAHSDQCRDNVCGACSGVLTVVQGRFYELEIGFAENTGDENLDNRWDTSAGDDATGNIMDTECYPFYGDEWLLTTSVSSGTEEIFKGVIPENGSAIPFYTINSNPREPSSLACLANMTAGDYCKVTWTVNATGSLNSSHNFFVIVDPIVYSPDVSQANSSIVVITITDASLVPPAVTLNIPANNTFTNNPEVIFNCSATDNIGLENMTLFSDFNGTYAPNETQALSGTDDSSEFNKTLSDGEYLWNCRAYDTDDNEGWGNYIRTLTVDTVAPTITLFNPTPAQVFLDNDIMFRYKAVDLLDPSMICNITINNTVEFSYIPSSNNTLVNRTKFDMAEGVYYWNVTCIDDAGNLNISETRSFTIQDVPPNVTLITENNTYFNSSSLSLFFNASDNNGISNVTLYLKGIEYTSRDDVVNRAIESFDLTGITEGTYTWFLNVTDTGNLTAVSETRVFYVDLTPPTINVTFPPDSHNTTIANITINFTAIDNMADTLICNITVNDEIVIENFNATNNTATLQSHVFQDGLSSWNITCVDYAGNKNSSSTRTINVSAAPVVTLIAPPSGHAQKPNSIGLTYLPYDNTNLTSCELLLDSSFNQTNTSITNNQNNFFNLSGLDEGIYEWAVNCTDTIGLYNTSETWNFTIDSTIPNITLLFPDPEDSLLGSLQFFNFTVQDNVDNYLVCNLSVDTNTTGNELFLAPNGSIVTRNFTLGNEGIHFWFVKCVDDAGNIATTETRNFTNQNPPTVILNTPADGAVFNVSIVNLTYKPFDSGGLNNTFLILNGNLNWTNENPINDEFNNFTLTNLADGVYTWTVNASDNTGLMSAANETRTFTVDTTAPNVTAFNPFNGETLTSNNVTFNFTVIDNLASTLFCNLTTNETIINLNVTNNSIATYNMSFRDGDYNWSVVCVDTANNQDYTGIINFTVDAPPLVNLVSPLNNSRTANTTISFTYTPYDPYGLENCTLVLDGVHNVSSDSILNNQAQSFLADNITEGDHNWTVQCIDEAPDFNPFTPAIENFTIDISGPTINLTYPGPAQTLNQNNVTFNYTPSDHALNTFNNCTIRVSDSGGERINYTNEIEGTAHVKMMGDLADGQHFWNVTCVDDLGNVGFSGTANFTINQPDLDTDDSRLTFNETNPDLNSNITIVLNVTNLGGVTANNVIVEFWEGERYSGTAIGNDTITVAVNASVLASVTWIITSGYHSIYAYVDPDNLLEELNESNNNATTNISAIFVNITSPPNNTLTTDTTPSINFTAYDYTTTGILNYTIFVDGTSNGQTGINLDGNSTTIEITALAEGTHLIVVETKDALNRRKNSTGLKIIVDLNPPSPVFVTINETWFNTSTPNIYFNITDAIDSLLNWTLYQGGTPVKNGTATSGAITNQTIGPLGNGTYLLILEAWDEAGNIANSTILTIYVDTVSPGLTLNAPSPGENFTSTSVALNYSATDNLDQTLICNVTLDSSVVNSTIALNGSTQVYTATGLTEGTHYWNVTCLDSAYNKNISETRDFGVFIAPTTTALTPLNNTVTKVQNISFTFNVTDDTGIENCSLLIEGVINKTKQGSDITNGGISNITQYFYSSQNLEWAIQCYDNTSLNVYSVTGSYNLTIDLLAPTPNIETINETWFNSATPSIDFNITDNFDSLINYTFWTNGAFNTNGAVNNGASSSDNLAALGNGAHTLVLEGRDDAGNAANTSTYTIYIDTQEPNVTLLYPGNNTNWTVTTLELNFTVIDNLDDVLVCNLTLDGSNISTNFDVNNNSVSNTTVTDLGSGYHYWNATCVDEAGNSFTSQTWQFLIEAPDLTILEISINATTPQEGENITIFANISNIGNLVSNNVTVQF
ncbi:PA14 domain-containing protein, partial [Nanoarchaeota archaeon]